MTTIEKTKATTSAPAAAPSQLKTVQYLNKKYPTLESEDISRLFKDFKKYGIKVSFPSADGKCRRFIFSSTKSFRFGGKIDEFVSECNGLVLLFTAGQTSPWSLLVKPILTFRTGINEKYINQNLHKFSITRVNEGTTINLYHFDGSWRMSTSRGYDVTDLVWNRKKTYKEVFREVLAKRKIDLDDFFAALDTESSYVFGFKHPDFHPFWEGKTEGIYDFWFIQRFHSTKGLCSPLTSDGKSMDFPLQSERTLAEEPTNVKQLFKKLGNSLKDYVENKNVLYGYILQTVDENIPPENRNILLESSLLKNIRKLFYHSNFQKESREAKFNREKYVITVAFLSGDQHETFQNLFPQYAGEFEEYTQIYEKLLKELVGIYTKTTSTSNYAPFANNIAGLLNQKITITPKTQNLEHVLSTFILDPVFAKTFYSLRWDLSTEENEKAT